MPYSPAFQQWSWMTRIINTFLLLHFIYFVQLNNLSIKLMFYSLTQI